jgi:hypothetical protein
MKPNIFFILLDGSRLDRLEKSVEFMELKKEGTLLNNIIISPSYAKIKGKKLKLLIGQILIRNILLRM